jgi:sulfur-oxidizing protein SoxY
MRMTRPRLASSRRWLLKGCASVGLFGLGEGAGGLAPVSAAAIDSYPEQAFRQKTEADAIKARYGRTAEPSDLVKLDAPEIAENGAVVPISVSSTLPDVSSIALLVSGNPNALAACYTIPSGTLPMISNRLKMQQTCNVVAIVEASGKLYSASKEVKVTVGGCGG